MSFQVPRLLSYSSNPLLSKDDSKLMIFPGIGRPFADPICMIIQGCIIAQTLLENSNLSPSFF
jgi:hypothetical protein